MNYLIHLFIIFIIKVHFINGEVNIIKSNIYQKSSNIFGVEYNYAIGDIEFNEDLYYYESWVSCPNFQCPSPNNGNLDCSCDYTDKDECPKVKSGCSPCSISEEYFQCKSSNWTTVGLDQLYTFTTSENMQLRYKADPLGCYGLSVKINSIEGYGVPSVGRALYSGFYSKEYPNSYQRSYLFNVCPSSYSQWNRDTYFIQIKPLTPQYKFSIILRSLQVVNNLPSPTCTKTITPGYSCLSLNRQYIVNIGIYTAYTLAINSSDYYYFSFTQPLGTYKVYISNDPNNQTPSLDNSTWQFTDEGDQDAILYLEPISDTEPLILYIAFDPPVSVMAPFSINTYGKKYLSSISSSASIQSGYLNLRGTSKLLVNSGSSSNSGGSSSSSSSSSSSDNSDSSIYYSSSINTKSNKIPFSILYPQTDLNSFYVPSMFIHDYALQIKPDQSFESFSTFKPRSYQISFLLSQKKSGIQIINYQNYDAIKNSTLIIDSNLYDKNEKPIKLNIKFNEIEINSCNISNYNKLSKLVNNYKELLNNLSIDEIGQSLSLVYNLNLITSSDIWIGCKNKFNQYYETESKELTKGLKICQYKESDPLYKKSPCCNPTANYYECCNTQLVTSNFTINKAVKLDLVKNECSSLDCTLSVLAELNTTYSSVDDCLISDYKLNKNGFDTITVLRECKSVLDPPYCSSDSDCIGYGSASCNLFNRRCLPNFKVIDKRYIECVLSNLTTGTLFYLLNQSLSYNQTTIDNLYNQHSSLDCTLYQSFMDRTTYELFSALLNPICNKEVACIDSTCLLHHDICYEGYVNDLVFSQNSKLNCEQYGHCPSGCVYNSVLSPFCSSQCIESFCGYCSNNETQCYNIVEATNQETCNTQPGICLLNDGQYLTNISEEECTQQKGICTHECGYECVTGFDDLGSACVIGSAFSKEQCSSIANTKWSSKSNGCQFTAATNQEECIANNYVWIECSNKSVEAGECVGTILNNNLYCVVKGIPCSTKEECLSIAGECSDRYYFSNLASSVYPEGLGKCTGNHINLVNTMACHSYEKDSPMGCYYSQPAYYNKQACESSGRDNKWWTFAKSKEECESHYGCKVIAPVYVNNVFPYNFKFNEMNQEQCNGCDESFNQWTNKFEWRSAQWLPGVYKNPSWLQNKQFISNKQEQIFNYQLFYSSINNAINSQQFELRRTEEFCRVERIQNSLNTLTCSCLGGSGGSECFGNESPVIGQVKVCSSEVSDFKFDFGLINFNNSIEKTCQTFTISQISNEMYSSSIKQSLASTFVKYNKPESKSILNKKESNVGKMLSDGIMIKSKEGTKLNNIQMCFKRSAIENLNEEKYPVLDFAIQENSNTYPTPMRVEIQVINSTFELYYCCNISNVPFGDPIYFMISRYQDWEDREKELFDSETSGLMYTLASIFLLVGLVGIFEVSTIIYYYITKKLVSFQPIQLLIITTTIFIVIRSIYFFLLVNGHLSNNPVLDYILVVLPTFIYFTSFTIIISMWFVLFYLFLKNNRGSGISNKFYKAIGIVNVLLYLFFIVVVLVFQYGDNKVDNLCGSRIFIPSELSSTQKAISLAYSILQISLSLIIGVAFIYLGKELYSSISNNKSLSKSNHQQKIFIISILASTGFILHCVFLIVLVTNINSMVFSFIGLVITEVIPSLSIFIVFNPKSIRKQRVENEKVGKKKQKNNKIKLSNRNSNSNNTQNNNNNNNNNNNSTANSNINSNIVLIKDNNI